MNNDKRAKQSKEDDILGAMQKISQMMANDQKNNPKEVKGLFDGITPTATTTTPDKVSESMTLESTNKKDKERPISPLPSQKPQSQQSQTRENAKTPIRSHPESKVTKPQKESGHIVDKPSKSPINLSREAMDSLLGKTHDTLSINSQRSTKVVNRLYELNGKKNEKIAALQYQKYREEISELKPKPEILLTSKMIAQQKIPKTIDKRVKDILIQKEEKIRKLKEEIEERKKANEPILTFKPEINKKNPNEKHRTPKELHSQLVSWQMKKNEAIQKEQYEAMTKELESFSFKPAIDSKSRKIIAQKMPGEKIKVEDRLQSKKEEIEEKKRILEEKSKPSFKPQISEKSYYISKNKAKEYDHPWQTRSRSSMNKSLNGALTTRHFEEEEAEIDDDDDGYEVDRLNRSVNYEKKSKFEFKLNKRVFNQPKVNEVEYTPAIDFMSSRGN